MDKFIEGFNITEDIFLGGGQMVLFSGPCAVENYEVCAKLQEH